MGNLILTNTFQENEPARAAEVNANFDDVRTFVNSQVVHKDGTNPFTVMPILPSSVASGVTTAATAANKAYVDAASAAASAALAAASAASTAYTDAAKTATAWGRVAGLAPANFTFSTSIGDSATLTFNQVAGRRYRVTVSAEYQSASANPTVATVLVRNSANAVVEAVVLRWTSRDASDQHRASGVFTYNPPSSASVTWKLSAQLSLAAGTATIVDPMLLVEDMGPV